MVHEIHVTNVNLAVVLKLAQGSISICHKSEQDCFQHPDWVVSDAAGDMLRHSFEVLSSSISSINLSKASTGSQVSKRSETNSSKIACFGVERFVVVILLLGMFFHSPFIRNHPRVCGAYSSVSAFNLIFLGPSPRMRAALILIACFATVTGIIPAYAGRTLQQKLKKDRLIYSSPAIDAVSVSNNGTVSRPDIENVGDAKGVRPTSDKSNDLVENIISQRQQNNNDMNEKERQEIEDARAGITPAYAGRTVLPSTANRRLTTSWSCQSAISMPGCKR